MTEMAQWIKCLTCKCEDLSSDPHESKFTVSNNHSALELSWEVETGESSQKLTGLMYATVTTKES